jgi:hypothetical protein
MAVPAAAVAGKEGRDGGVGPKFTKLTLQNAQSYRISSSISGGCGVKANFTHIPASPPPDRVRGIPRGNDNGKERREGNAKPACRKAPGMAAFGRADGVWEWRGVGGERDGCMTTTIAT